MTYNMWCSDGSWLSSPAYRSTLPLLCSPLAWNRGMGPCTCIIKSIRLINLTCLMGTPGSSWALKWCLLHVEPRPPFLTKLHPSTCLTFSLSLHLFCFLSLYCKLLPGGHWEQRCKIIIIIMIKALGECSVSLFTLTPLESPRPVCVFPTHNTWHSHLPRAHIHFTILYPGDLCLLPERLQ